MWTYGRSPTPFNPSIHSPQVSSPRYHGHLFTSRVGSENVDLTYRLNASAFLDTRNRSSLVVTDSLGNIAIYHPPL